jgi:hypothetical protein
MTILAYRRPDRLLRETRMSTRLPESREEILLVESLLSSRKIDRIKKGELDETMFELMIDGKTPKEAKAEAMELRSEALALRSRLAEAVDVQTTLQKALEQESREREKMSLELTEMQRQLAELKNSK